MDPLVFFGGPISVASWVTLGFPMGDGLDTHGFPPGPPKCGVCSKAVRHALSTESLRKLEDGIWGFSIIHKHDLL